MSFRVLISAYACEPGKGSEPEVGWQWALQMARFHEVMVLTRENNRANIEAGLAALEGKQPLPKFVYHDESPFLLWIKRRFGLTKLYYFIWQSSVREIITRLHQDQKFDLLHHVTFAAFRYRSAIWGHGVPCIWGPVGGIESIPFRLLPWSHPRSLVMEAARSIHNLIQTSPFQVLPGRAAASTIVLASTPEMQGAFEAKGFKALLEPAIGLHTGSLPEPAETSRKGPLKLLFVGNIITLKGVDLALLALAESKTDATLTLVGDGDFMSVAQRLASRLGLGDRVTFRGRLPRPEVLALYREFDVLLFPSLHDTGGYSVIEAMSNSLPVICIDCGGPGLAVRGRSGYAIKLGPKSSMVSGIATAIRAYTDDRSKLSLHGHNAVGVIKAEYDWNRKGERMNAIYHQATAMAAGKAPRFAKTDRSAGRDGTPSLLRRMFSLKGLTAGLVLLLLVGAIEFLSLSRLKQVAGEIVNDTMPGLAYAGGANAYLADAYRTLLFIDTTDAAARAEIRQQMDTLAARTSDYLSKYHSSIFTSEDEANFQALLKLREAYQANRSKILDLASSGKTAEATLAFHQTLIPMQSDLKKAGEKLLAYNMREGEERGRSIMRICTVTQIFVALMGISIFILGFVLGFFK